MSTTHEHDAQLLAVGQQCSESHCNLVDFLPFKCQHCAQPFCADHFLPNQHKCDKYDESKHNRIAPPCPLCNTPVAIPPGQDPNVRMEHHITSECSVMTGRAVKSSTPHCANIRCNKVLFAPISCDSCKQQFCPQHRFPKDHVCITLKPKAAPLLAPRSAAAMAAIKRAANSANASTSRLAATKPTSASAAKPTLPKAAAPSTAASSSSSSRTNPFSKTDRISFAPGPSRLTRDVSPSRTHDTTSSSDATKRCIPKPASNLLSFAPPPLFATA